MLLWEKKTCARSGDIQMRPSSEPIPRSVAQVKMCCCSASFHVGAFVPRFVTTHEEPNFCVNSRARGRKIFNGPSGGRRTVALIRKNIIVFAGEMRQKVTSLGVLKNIFVDKVTGPLATISRRSRSVLPGLAR
jgi:hypothetical protein